MLVDSNEKVKNLLKYKKDLPGLERIIVHEDVKAKKRKQAESMGIQMHSMKEVEVNISLHKLFSRKASFSHSF